MIGPTMKLKKPPNAALVKLNKIARNMKSAHVKVGFPKDSGSYPDGTPVVDVAIYNEFGTETIPERSFIRSSYSDNLASYKKDFVRIGKAVAKGTTTTEIGLKALGLKAVDDIQQKISSTKSPANADSTIKSKGSSHPLIDTGLLRQSVTFQVEAGKNG